MKKAVSINDIAEALGLSRNTVSKALNGRHVPNKTREAVLRKAQELNYKSLNNNLLSSHKYRLLLLSGKPLHNMNFYVPLVKSVENYCYDHNYDFFEFTYNASDGSFEKIAAYVHGLRVDGIVAIECFDPAFVNSLLNLGVPTCFIDFPGKKFEVEKKYDLITAHDQKAVCEYVKTLYEQYKIRRFTFVGDIRHCLSFHERYMGMLRGLSRSGLRHSVEEDLIMDDNAFDYGDSNAMKDKILFHRAMPDCFICCNDFVARNVATAIRKIGYRIPEDTMVVGFDGVAEAEERAPLITTFYVDKEFLGQEAIRLLVSRIEKKDAPSRTIMVDCDLIVRESTTK